MKRMTERYPKACERLEELLRLRNEVRLKEEESRAMTSARMREESAAARRDLARAQERLNEACALADRLLTCVKCPADRVTLKLRYVHGLRPAVVRRGLGISDSGYYKRLDRGLRCVEKRIWEESEAGK